MWIMHIQDIELLKFTLEQYEFENKRFKHMISMSIIMRRIDMLVLISERTGYIITNLPTCPWQYERNNNIGIKPFIHGYRTMCVNRY